MTGEQEADRTTMMTEMNHRDPRQRLSQQRTNRDPLKRKRPQPNNPTRPPPNKVHPTVVAAQITTSQNLRK